MPSLRIQRNGEHLCTAGSDDVRAFSANVWGDVFGPEAAVLDVTGGTRAVADTPGDFLVWECPVALARGDLLEMFFEAASESRPLPLVFCDNAANSGEPKSLRPGPPTEREMASLEARERRNDGILFSVRIGDVSVEVAPDTSRQHVGLRVSWRERRPDSILVSLSRKSLREIVARADGEVVYKAELPVGSNLAVAIAA